MADNTLPQLKQDLIDYVGLLLGNQIIDLELEIGRASCRGRVFEAV